MVSRMGFEWNYLKGFEGVVKGRERTSSYSLEMQRKRIVLKIKIDKESDEIPTFLSFPLFSKRLSFFRICIIEFLSESPFSPINTRGERFFSGHEPFQHFFLFLSVTDFRESILDDRISQLFNHASNRRDSNNMYLEIW